MKTMNKLYALAILAALPLIIGAKGCATKIQIADQSAIFLQKTVLPKIAIVFPDSQRVVTEIESHLSDLDVILKSSPASLPPGAIPKIDAILALLQKDLSAFSHLTGIPPGEEQKVSMGITLTQGLLDFVYGLMPPAPQGILAEADPAPHSHAEAEARPAEIKAAANLSVEEMKKKWRAVQ